MGSIIVGVRVRGSRGEATVRALIDTGFYGDLITLPRYVEGIGI